MKLKQFFIKLMLVFFATTAMSYSANAQITLKKIGGFASGQYNVGAAEVTAYDPATKRFFVSNGADNKIYILNATNPYLNPLPLVSTINLGGQKGFVNSITFGSGVLAVCLEDSTLRTNAGKVSFYDASGTFLKSVTVGVQPDMITFTPDGKKLLTADEGEPNTTYTVDPEGSVTVIDFSNGISGVSQSSVSVIDFKKYNSLTIDAKIRVFGPGSTKSQDFEPEYITVSADSKTAYITLQENNAIAILDIDNKNFTALKALGYKDHSLTGNGFDASDRAKGTYIQTWPVFGMYLPDAISSYQANGKTYLVTANEGDSREYSAFNEEGRINSLNLDATAFPNAAILKNDTLLGRLKVTKTLGDTDGDGDYDKLYSFGSRSFTIWDDQGVLVWDSGDQFEKQVLKDYPLYFNTSHSNNTRKDRSDDKGPEPEGVDVGKIGDSTYAFVCLERACGVMVYNITNPTAPKFVQYINTRDFTKTPALNSGGDLGPEVVKFIDKSVSPTGRHMLSLSNEVSGTFALFEIQINRTTGVSTKKYALKTTPLIGTYDNKKIFEGGLSGLDFVNGSNLEFYTVGDRGPNVVATNSLKAAGKDVKFFPFPAYAPKLWRVRAEGDSIRILNISPIKRPSGTNISGLPNPLNSGGTGETAWSDTSATVVAPDAWGIDNEGVVEGYSNDLWMVDEYGPSVIRVDRKTTRIMRRYNPFGNDASLNQVGLDTILKRRTPNRGFEGVAITPNGKVYAIVQSAMRNPSTAVGNASTVQRLVEIDPITGTSKMYAYINPGTVGQLRPSDWKIGDMTAINDSTLLVLEHAERNGWNVKNIYKINLLGATPITAYTYGGKTPEELTEAGLIAAGITPVKKTFFFDLLENGWDLTHDKPEGLTIVNKNTIAVINDNDFGVDAPAGDGKLVLTGKTTSLYVFTLPVAMELKNFRATAAQMAITPIGDINKVNATTGVADSVNKRFTVQGIVYGVNLRTTGVQFTLRDQTGGIGVFSSGKNFGYTVNEGDSIQVIGGVAQFNGLTQLTLSTADTIILLGSGFKVKNPVSVSKINEASESDLVILNEPYRLVLASEWPTSASANVRITNFSGMDTVLLRVVNTTDLKANPAPTGYFRVTGLGGQFDNSNPFTSGYQLFPRSMKDVVLVSPEVTIIKDTTSVSEGGGSINLGYSVKYVDAVKEIAIRFTLSGTATRGTDYTASDSLVIAPNTGTGNYNVAIVDDKTLESDEIVTVTIASIRNGVRVGPNTKTDLRIRENDVTGIKNANSNKNGLKLYPNPTNRLVNIDLPKAASSIQVVDMEGKVVYSINSQRLSGTTTLDLDGLGSGTYIVNIIYVDNTVQTTSFTKQD